MIFVVHSVLGVHLVISPPVTLQYQSIDVVTTVLVTQCDQQNSSPCQNHNVTMYASL